jgi:hypothetical protein
LFLRCFFFIYFFQLISNILPSSPLSSHYPILYIYSNDDAFLSGAPNPSTISFSSGVAAVSSTNSLAAFNTQFREKGESFDVKERDLKNARKTSGKTALKKMLAERKSIIDQRKAKNRDEEAATEQAMLDALQGENWARAVTLVDVLSTPTGAHSASKGGKTTGGSKSEGTTTDTSRMKDILIALKAKPLQ